MEIEQTKIFKTWVMSERNKEKKEMIKKLLLILIPILLCIAGVVFVVVQQNNTPAQPEGNLMDKKILIAYYSRSGNTKTIAQEIQKQTNGELFELIPSQNYPSGYDEMTEYAKKEISQNITPPLKENKDISSYGVIFIGTPIWWGKMATPVKTFLKGNNFEEKTIIPFVTHGGGGGYSISKDMQKLAPKAKVLNQFTVYGAGDSSTQDEISNWISTLK